VVQLGAVKVGAGAGDVGRAFGGVGRKGPTTPTMKNSHLLLLVEVLFFYNPAHRFVIIFL